jgi:hypothetical protein
VLASAATAIADPGHEPYISGAVLQRVPGQNASNVAIRWNFSCLKDEFGDATYEYTVVLHRLQPLPEQMQTLTRATSRAGGYTLPLTPGRYRADADPFRCETGINLFSTSPEKGMPFVVPDYCAFTARLLRGVVTVSGRRLFADGKVRPRDKLVIPARGSVVLGDETSSEIRISDAAGAMLDRGTCATTPGWRWTLLRGTLAASSPSTPARYEIAAGAAVAAGSGASWTTSVRGRTVSIAVARGRVTLRAQGKTTTLGRGRTLTVG